MTLDEARGCCMCRRQRRRATITAADRRRQLFAESLVCLDGRYWNEQWHFRWFITASGITTTRRLPTGHDHRRRQRIDAVAQVTKQGFTYTSIASGGHGAGVAIVERPVDTQTDVPGEETLSDAAISLEATGVRGSRRIAGRGQRPVAAD